MGVVTGQWPGLDGVAPMVNPSGSPGDVTPPIPPPTRMVDDTVTMLDPGGTRRDWRLVIYDMGAGRPARVERYLNGEIELVGQVEAYKAWTLAAHWTEDPDVY